MMINKCKDCNHRNICKYKDDYDKVIKNIVVSVPEPFTLILDCSHYYSTHAYLNNNYEGYRNTANSISPTTTLAKI
jgi:hypothetical protein